MLSAMYQRPVTAPSHRHMPATEPFLSRLRHAGIEGEDSEDLKIRKTIMVFAMGLMTAAPMFWLSVYWLMGIQLLPVRLA